MDFKDKRIVVIGLGYVGLPLAVEFGKKFEVLGFDINNIRINELRSHYDRTGESTPEEISASKSLRFSSDNND